MRLRTDQELEQSWVVANSSMNRERSLTGSNGYRRELGLDIMRFLTERLDRSEPVRWLDLCCGSGRALLAAAGLLRARVGACADPTGVELTGVDLVGYFAGPEEPPLLRLVTASVRDWAPDGRYDLITIVHGLHYIGDKLGLLARASGWLTEDGLLAATFDPHGIRHQDGISPVRAVVADLRRQGFGCDTRNHRITRTGYAQVSLPYRYLGAQPDPEPNYTGQAAVISVYTRG